jgi:hypothetical protein
MLTFFAVSKTPRLSPAPDLFYPGSPVELVSRISYFVIEIIVAVIFARSLVSLSS